MEKRYELSERQKRIVRNGRAIGILGPRAPNGTTYAAEISRLEAGNHDYDSTLISYMGHINASPPARGDLEAGLEMLRLAQAGILQVENNSESTDLQRWRTHPQFPSLGDSKAIDAFVLLYKRE